MKISETLIPYIPYVYIFAAICAMISIIVIGVVPTPLEGIASSGEAAGYLRQLLTLPMPFALAVYCGFSRRNKEFYAVVLLLGILMVLTASLLVALFFAIAIYSLVRERITHYKPVQPPLAQKQLYLWVVGITIFTFALRLLVLNEPFERDLMVYAMVASGWLDGLKLYAEIWDHKPPAIYVVYAAAIGLLGQTSSAILTLGMIAFTMTLIGIKTAAERLYGHSAAVVAMLIWAVFGNDVILQAQQPNVEVFMNACLIWALVFLLDFSEDQRRFGCVLFAGILFFCASALKQIAVFPAFLTAIWLIWLSIKNQNEPLGAKCLSGCKTVALFAIPGVVGWISILLSFHFYGSLEEFFYGAFGYNQSYAGSIFLNFVKMALRDIAHPYYIATFILLVFSFRFLGNHEVSLLMLAMYVGNAIMVAAPGNNFPHYFQLLLPIMAVGLGVHIAKSVLETKLFGTTLILLAPLWISFGYFTSPERLAFIKYGERYHGGQSYESREIGWWLAKNTTPDEGVFHWGAEPGIYFWSGRPTKYRFSYNYPLFNGPRQQEFSDQLVRELRCEPPEIVVINTRMIDNDHPVTVFLERTYSRDSNAPSFNFFQIWERGTAQLDCP